MREEAVVAQSEKGLSRPERTLIGLILFWIAWPLLLLLKYHPGLSRRDSFEILMPRCEECANQEGPLVPEHVNLQRETMVFIVARSFADLVKGKPSDADAVRGPYRTREDSSTTL